MMELKTSKGIENGIEYGFIRMLKNTIDEIKPDNTFVIFDGGLSKFRMDILPEYKANRKSSGSLEKPLRNIQNFLDTLGINHFSYLGVEADDIIGLISSSVEENETMIIASSDTDFCQLIKENIKVYNPITKQYLEPIVEPSKYVFWKAMVGDKSDNITGIPGIGEKKAKARVKGNIIKNDPNPEYVLLFF
jgi:DNA polymerase-1